MSTLYAGPAKVFFNSISLFPEGENGPCNVVLEEKAADVASAMHGKIGETWEDITAKISFVPFDNWGNMATLYPAYTGITVGAGTGALVIGSNPFAMNPVVIWSPDGTSYSFVNGAVTRHPDLFLGPSKPLFGQCEMTCIGDPTKAPGASAFLMASTPIAESAAADPGGAFTMSDFERGWWSGAWGAISGFVGMEAEDFWTIQVQAKYSFQTVQKVTRRAKLDSIAVMAKARLVGPTHSNIAAVALGHTHGQLLQHASATDLVLTGPSSKTVTLKNCELKGAGFEFGGTRLRTGEVGFVNVTTFTTGAPQPVLVISA